MAYNGSVELISGIKQANSQDFPLVDAAAVRVDDDTRLNDALMELLPDDTLSIPGKAADAAAVGDAFALIDNRLEAVENLTGSSVKTYLTGWQNGRIIPSTGYQQSDKYVYSETLVNDDTDYYFDAAEYRLVFCAYTSADNDAVADPRSSISSWITQSPARSPMDKISYGWVRIALERLDNGDIDPGEVSVYSTVSETSAVVEAVNELLARPAFTTDVTLTLPGEAADAAAVGDAAAAIDSRLDGIENLTGVSVQTYLTGWQNGRITPSTGYQQSDKYVYSETLINDDTDYYFDAAKYRLAFCSYISADNDAAADPRSATSSWITRSPARSPMDKISYGWVRIALQRLDNGDIDPGEVSVYSTACETSAVVEAVNELLARRVCTYVDGSAAASGDGSIESPYQTIQQAVNDGSPVVKVRCVDGNGNAITYGPFSVTDRDTPLAIMPWSMPTYQAGTSDQDLPKIKVTGAAASPYHGIVISSCAEISLSDVWVDDVPRHCYSITDVGKLECVRCYASHNTTANFSGFRLVNVNGVFRDCKAWGVTLDGFNIHGYGNTEFINCIGYECGDDGISHHDSCTGCIIGGEYYSNGKGGISSPYGGAEIDVNGAYTHDNTRYGIYADSDGTHPPIHGRICNCAAKNNGTADIYVADGVIVGWNNVYDTRSIQETGTFTEIS